MYKAGADGEASWEPSQCSIPNSRSGVVGEAGAGDSDAAG